MEKKYLIVLGMAVFALNLSACKDPTRTEVSDQSTVNGTTVESSTVKQTDMDANGNTTTRTDSKTTVDPEGLMNKETIEKTTNQETHKP